MKRPDFDDRGEWDAYRQQLAENEWLERQQALADAEDARRNRVMFGEYDRDECVQDREERWGNP